MNVETRPHTHEPLNETFDVAIMSAFMPVLGADSIRRALKTINKCLKPGGKLYVTDAGMIDDSRLSPNDALTTNLNFINLSNSPDKIPVCQNMGYRNFYEHS